MRVYSNNDLAAIGDNLAAKGHTAWMNSLHYEFSFVKNAFVTKALLILSEEILGQHQFSPLIRSFKKINLEANFSSA